MQLSELLKDWPCVVKGSIRTEIVRIEDVAQQVQAGDLYMARQGKQTDGKKWISQAITNGAVAVVVDDELFFDEFDGTVPLIWVPNCQTFNAFANAKLYGHPSEVVQLIAITGTNGKTTVSHFIGQLLHACHKSALVIGTIGVYEHNMPLDVAVEPLTTLKPQHLQSVLQNAVRKGITHVVLEASSMGLAQHRLDDCAIDIGVFLNLSADHIEDHGTLTQYKLAKQRLVQLSDVLIINQDDSYCRGVGTLTKKRKQTFSLKGKANVVLQVLAKGNWQTTCCIQDEDEQIVLTLPLVGDYQMQNVLAAVTVMKELGFSLEQLAVPLQRLYLPEGRMKVFRYAERAIIVDYAHTTDALKEMLKAVKEQAMGRIIVVFSCGGNRDQAKRKEMGTVASKYADLIVLTTDNSRTEDPSVINQQIKEGFFATQAYKEILDRGQAITYATELAQVGDTVVIAGKGHETTQTIGDVTYDFSDIGYVEALLATFNNEEGAGRSR